MIPRRRTLLVALLLCACTPVAAAAPAFGSTSRGAPTGVAVAGTASAGWRSCAARPVPLPPPRAAGAAAVAAVSSAMGAWQAARRARIPAVSVAVRWDDGREILAATGFANRATKQHVSVTTPFSLASVTKSFTAAVALLLDACGVMPLGTTAASLVPSASIDPSATIEDLLRHRSGIGDWLNDKPWRFDWLVKHPSMAVSPLTVVKSVDHTIRGEYNYSNSGFTLVTIAAERATGRPWKELVRTLLLQPLGLTQTGYGPVATAARSHWGVGRQLLPRGSAGWGPTRSVASALRGAGDLFSTPRDLARFGELFWGSRLIDRDGSLLLNGAAQPNGSGLLYTLGTQVRRDWDGPIRVYGHTGGFSGTTTAVERVPALGITIAAVSNGSPNAYESYAVSLARALLAALDRPAADPYGVPRPTAASMGDPEPPDPPLVAPTEGCGDAIDAAGSGSDASARRWVRLGGTEGWSGSIAALVELPDGRIVAGGTALTRAAGVAVSGLAAWDPRTGRWSPFAALRSASGGVGSVAALVVDARRGLLYVGGSFSRVGGANVPAAGVAQLNLATGAWSALGKGLSGAMRGGDASVAVRALALDPTSGMLAVGGSFARAGGASSAGAARWTPAKKGGSWRALGTGAGGVVDAIAVDGAGGIAVAGHLGTDVVRSWSPTTGAWETAGTASLFADAPRLLVATAAGLLAGRGVGWYGPALQIRDSGSGSGWSAFAGDVTYPRRTAWVSAGAALADGRIAIGGSFQVAGGAAAGNVAVVNPNGGVEALGNGLPVEPDALAASDHATLIAATRTRGATAGSAGGRCIAAWSTPAPPAPSNPGARATAVRGALAVTWISAPTGAAPDGFRATASAKGRSSRSCSASAGATGCTITGLASKVVYAVSVVAWSDPAGPSTPAVVSNVRPR